MAEIIIKLNDNPNPNACPFCQVQTNPNIGAELFLAGTNMTVCFGCASKRAPILAGLIAFENLSRIHLDNENRFGQKWENEKQIKGSSMNTYQDFGFEKREVING